MACHSVGKREEDGPCQSPVREVGHSIGKGEEDGSHQGGRSFRW